MAIQGASLGDRLTRAGAYLDTTQSFTILGWGQQVTLQADTTFTTWRMFGDPAFVAAYLFVGTYTDGTETQLYAEIFDGLIYTDSSIVVAVPGTWYGCAVVVDQPNGEIRFSLVTTPGDTPTLVGTIPVDVSAITFGVTTECAYGDPAAPQPVAWGYDRVFASALTPAQIRTELASAEAVVTALADTPLRSPTDLADISGNGRDWTAVGTPVYLTGPLSPSNLTAATARVIASAPDTITQDVTDAPDFHTVWYTWTCPTGVTFAYLTGARAAESDPSYVPGTTVWVGTVDALTILESSEGVQYFDSLSNGPSYFRIPVTHGTQYWFQFDAADAEGPQILELQLLLPPTDVAPIGSFVITDDADGFPAAVFSPTGTFLRFPVFPSGEFTATMPNGLYCTQDGNADLGVAMYGPSWTRLASQTFSGASVAGIYSDNTAYFYVYAVATGPIHKLYTLDRLTGAIVRTTVLGTALKNGAPSPDGTRFYVGKGTGTGTVEIDVWDLPNNVLLTTWSVSIGAGCQWFTTSKPGWTTSDGSIFFAFGVPPATTKILKLSPVDGSVLQTYVTAQGSVTKFTRVCPISDTQFGVWGVTGVPQDPSYFQVVAISDGVMASESAAIHITNNSVESADASPNCISNSCPVFVLTHSLGSTPPPGPGTERMIRRVRQFLLPSSDSNHAMFMPELEVLLQPGIGLTDPDAVGYDPQVMLQISKDGGKTYGPEQWASAGKQGDYTKRVRFRRTPNRYRNGVVRLVMTDPVDWTLLDVVTPKVEEGTS